MCVYIFIQDKIIQFVCSSLQQNFVESLVPSIFISFSPHSNQTLSLDAANVISFTNDFHIAKSSEFFHIFTLLNLLVASDQFIIFSTFSYVLYLNIRISWSMYWLIDLSTYHLSTSFFPLFSVLIPHWILFLSAFSCFLLLLPHL